MATYELVFAEDEDARVVANVIDLVLESPLSLANHSRDLLIQVQQAIADQIPIPAPVKIGAVVRAGDLGEVYIRWAYDNHTHSPWVAAGNHEVPFRTDEIGRITEVLSPGVDL